MSKTSGKIINNASNILIEKDIFLKLFNRITKIIFVYEHFTELENTNSKGDFVLKNWF